MVYRIIFLVALLIGMTIFIFNKCNQDEESSTSVKNGANSADSPAATRQQPAPRRANSAGNSGAGYKYEYQDDSGQWHPVVEFSQIPERFRGHFRPIRQQTGLGSSASGSQVKTPQPANAGQPAAQPNANQPGAAANDNKAAEGPSEAEKELSEFQKKQAEQEAMFKEWGAKCRSLGERRNTAQKAWDEVKDSIPPCQLKEEECYKKYDDYKAKLKQDIDKFNREYNDCRDEARKAGVPPGYLR